MIIYLLIAWLTTRNCKTLWGSAIRGTVVMFIAGIILGTIASGGTEKGFLAGGGEALGTAFFFVIYLAIVKLFRMATRRHQESK